MNEEKQQRKLKIDFSELAYAMEDSAVEHSYYLDLETGRTLMVADETRRQLEEIYEQSPDAEMGEGDFDLESSLKELDLPDWQKDVLREANEIENGFGSRYISIPHGDPGDSYSDMVDFIDTVLDEHLAELLGVAIDGKGAFRRFKDVLFNYPEEEKRWFKYKEDKQYERVMEWLDDTGIDIA
ncbi:UPF0158 family protein [Chloroflexota bacterium]